jgi:curli production assembly/transport component CsgG
VVKVTPATPRPAPIAITQLQVAYRARWRVPNHFYIGSRLAARQFFDQKFYFTEAGG